MATKRLDVVSNRQSFRVAVANNRIYKPQKGGKAQSYRPKW